MNLIYKHLRALKSPYFAQVITPMTDKKIKHLCLGVFNYAS